MPQINLPSTEPVVIHLPAHHCMDYSHCLNKDTSGLYKSRVHSKVIQPPLQSEASAVGLHLKRPCFIPEALLSNLKPSLMIHFIRDII